MDEARGGRQRLAHALTRVVAREGIAGISVRSVAAEAGVSGGAVQYHFPTRAEMIRYAMAWTSTQVEQRLARVPRWGDVHEWTRAVLLGLLPLDAERHREHAVWLAFVAHAETDSALATLKRETNAKLHGLYSRIIRARRGLPVPTDEPIAPTVDPDVEADAVLLQSLLDGLSLHLADLEPHEAERAGPELLDRYLARVIDPPAADQPG